MFLVFFGVCVNLNSRVKTLETSNDDLQKVIQSKNDELEKIKEKNTMQDVIINKLNNEYQMRERQRAEETKEVAEGNGVGG